MTTFLQSFEKALVQIYGEESFVYCFGAYYSRDLRQIYEIAREALDREVAP